ncbi:hypothetical protein X975_02115, partial [Stegodyphus mimosarum]
MHVVYKNQVLLTWMVVYVLAILLVSKADSQSPDCARHCRIHRVSNGNCRCRTELFTKKRSMT